MMTQMKKIANLTVTKKEDYGEKANGSSSKVAFESVEMTNRSESVVDDIDPYFGN